MNAAVVTTARARAARDLLDLRQAAYDRSPTVERRNALDEAVRLLPRRSAQGPRR